MNFDGFLKSIGEFIEQKYKLQFSDRAEKENIISEFVFDELYPYVMSNVRQIARNYTL